MKSALVRLLIITCSTILLLTMTVFWLRFLGQIQQHSTVDHPLLTKKPWLVLKIEDSHPTQTGFRSWYEANFKDANYIPLLDFRRTTDGHWLLTPVEWVEHPTGKRAVQALSFGEVQDLWPEKAPVELKEVIEILGERNVWINLIEKDPYYVKEIVNAFPETSNKTVIASSPVKQFGKKLRDAQPEWLYANDPSTLNQFLMLESLFLESIGSLWSDIFYGPAEVLGQKVFTQRMRAELMRRKLPVVFELSGSDENSNQALLSDSSFQLQGLVSNSREQLEKYATQIQVR